MVHPGVLDDGAVCGRVRADDPVSGVRLRLGGNAATPGHITFSPGYTESPSVKWHRRLICEDAGLRLRPIEALLDRKPG